MSAVIVIPARYGSTRFEGKPFQKIAGRSMLERVWRIAKSVKSASRVVIATEDERIVSFAKAFGADAVTTPAACANGTERVHAALAAAVITEDIVVNLQGDALLTPPWVLEAMIKTMEETKDAEIVTPAIELSSEALESFCAHKKTSPSSGSTVVFDRDLNALYFSKAVLPFLRHDKGTVYRHIGLYGYRRLTLERYIALPPSPLEIAEGLEQLRALEHGIKVRVVLVDYQGRTHGSLDAPSDIALIEAIIAREGELVP